SMSPTTRSSSNSTCSEPISASSTAYRRQARRFESPSSPCSSSATTGLSMSGSISIQPAWSARSAGANCSPWPETPMPESNSPRAQDQRRIEAECRLVLAAAELVGEIGPGNVTLAGVGQRAGYSRGLATHHFGSKAALMQRLVEAVTSQFRDAMAEQNQS